MCVYTHTHTHIYIYSLSLWTGAHFSLILIQNVFISVRELITVTTTSCKSKAR